MNTTYAQNSTTVQKAADSKAASILDSSAQNESLQRKADMANGAVQCFTIPKDALAECEVHSQQIRSIESSYDGMKGTVNVYTPYLYGTHRVYHLSKRDYDTIFYAGTGAGGVDDPMVFLGKGEHKSNDKYKVSKSPTGRLAANLNDKKDTAW